MSFMQQLDLKGLKIVWCGFLLSLIGGVINGLGSNANSGTSSITYTVSNSNIGATSIIGGILLIIAIVLTIVGLSKLKDLSEYYKKARNLYVISLIIGIIVAVICIGLVTLLFTATLTGAGTTQGGYGAGMAVVIIIAAVLVYIVILFYKNLLKGCHDTAELCGEDMLAEKFIRMWKLYIIGIILDIAGLVGMFIGSIASTFRSVSVQGGTTSMAAVVPGIILFGLGAVVSLIFIILLLIRMGKLCTFDGKSPGELKSTKPIEE